MPILNVYFIWFIFFVATVVPVCAWAEIPTLNSEAALKQAAVSGKPTLLEFGAQWCLSCTRMLPIIEAVAKETEFTGKINVIIIDIDKNESLAKKYKIHSIPVQIFLDDSGKEVMRYFGAIEKNELAQQLRERFQKRVREHKARKNMHERGDNE